MPPPPPTLHSYEPDLEVIVGNEDSDKKKTFKYYGAILAHHSAYVDALLSVPMKEQETRSLSFPDVQPDEWEKWMYHLEPLGSHKVLSKDIISEEMFAALAFYEKYQFRGGLDLCDYKIATLIKIPLRDTSLFRVRYQGFFEDAVKLAKVLHTDNYHLPMTKAKDVLPKFLAIGVQYWYNEVSQDDLQMILSFVFDADEESRKKALMPLVDIVCGATYVQRSWEDIKSIAKQDSFVSKLKAKIEEHKCHEGILNVLKVRYMHVNELASENAPELVSVMNGSYEVCERKPHNTDFGVMRFFYGKNIVEDDIQKSIVIQAIDGLGSVWIISKQDGDYSTRNEGGNATCLFRWNGKARNMIHPPKNGWEPVEAQGGGISTENVVDENTQNRITITYSLSDKDRY